MLNHCTLVSLTAETGDIRKYIFSYKAGKDSGDSFLTILKKMIFRQIVSVEFVSERGIHQQILLEALQFVIANEEPKSKVEE